MILYFEKLVRENFRNGVMCNFLTIPLGALRGLVQIKFLPPLERVARNEVRARGRLPPSRRINPARSRSFDEPKTTLSACFLTVLRY